MDFKPLKPDEFAAIARAIGYDKESCRAGRLYSKLENLDWNLEQKVKFILQHWGWDGSCRDEGKIVILEIEDLNFTVPENIKEFYRQFFGLTLPSKKDSEPADEYGGALRLKFLEKTDLTLRDWLIGAECLGARFDDDVLPMGYMLDYNGYSLSGQKIDGWEDPNYPFVGAFLDELYLGSSGRVYLWGTEFSDYIAVEADSLLNFFASSFGLIPRTVQSRGYAGEEDVAVMEKIEELWDSGEYRQNYFRGNKDGQF